MLKVFHAFSGIDSQRMAEERVFNNRERERVIVLQ